MSKRKKEQWAFFMGSFVGVGQAFLGMVLALRFGPAMAFVGSVVTYIAGQKLFMWATEDLSNEKSDSDQ